MFEYNNYYTIQFLTYVQIEPNDESAYLNMGIASIDSLILKVV